MEIASNTVGAVISHYQRELGGIYSESELQNIIYWVLEKQLGLSRTALAAGPQQRINESDLAPLERMCAELRGHRPVQYVLGEAEFFGYRYKVSEAVLIPRPETEELVERVLQEIKALARPVRVLDIGTGSGCIALTIRKQFADAQVFAIDISEAALEVARANALQLGGDVHFLRQDILAAGAADAVFDCCGREEFDIVVSNPPYVLRSEEESLHPRVRGFEPAAALFVEDTDPLLFYRRIAEAGQRLLRGEGVLWFECHAAHAGGVGRLLTGLAYKNVSVFSDLSGATRFSRGVLRQRGRPPAINIAVLAK